MSLLDRPLLRHGAITAAQLHPVNYTRSITSDKKLPSIFKESACPFSERLIEEQRSQ